MNIKSNGFGFITDGAPVPRKPLDFTDIFQTFSADICNIDMKKIYEILYSVVFTAFLLLSGCISDNTPSSDKMSFADSSLLPDSDLMEATIYLYDRGMVTTEIVSDKIVKYEKQDSTAAYQLDIIIFDSLGQVTSTIVGDSGVIREGRHQLFIYDHVVVHTTDSIKLETDYLFWNSRTNLIKAPENVFVKITQGKDIMTGWGLEADPKLSRYKILKQVSGTIYDTKKITEE